MQLAIGEKASRGHAYAAVATSIWVLHPLQLTTVLYAVQRVNGLAATGVLLGLFMLLHARIKMRATPSVLALAWRF